MALHPSESRASLLAEHASTITSFALDEKGLAWTPLGQTSNLPEESNDSGSRSSDIHTSVSGEFLFAVNQGSAGHIAADANDDQGALREVSRRSTDRLHARTFALDPQGKRLWIGNTRSNKAVALSIIESGVLGDAQGTWQAPAEFTCVLTR